MPVDTDYKKEQEWPSLNQLGRDGLVRQKQGRGDDGSMTSLWVGDTELALFSRKKIMERKLENGNTERV